jgi:hypothetical protein
VFIDCIYVLASSYILILFSSHHRAYVLVQLVPAFVYRPNLLPVCARKAAVDVIRAFVFCTHKLVHPNAAI